MRISVFTALFALALIACSGAAFADGRAFPPDHCSASSPFMAFTGIDGSNTFCDSGQDVFLNALPNCTSNQMVVFDGSKFICKDQQTINSCAADQVLTYTNSGFTCVKKNLDVPACGKNQFLTYNGSTFQCANVTNLTLPVCGKNQVVTSDGTQLTCIDGGGNNSGGDPCTAWCRDTNDLSTCNSGDSGYGGPYGLIDSYPGNGMSTRSVASGTMIVEPEGIECPGPDGGATSAPQYATFQCMNGSWQYINSFCQ